MLKDIKDILFSMKLMTALIFIFFLAIGTATFIENDFGTPAAKAWIYNARWFEVVIVLLMINFIGNIFRYNLLRKEKIGTLLFHVSFVVIIIGAGVTRYISFEGMMRIREGEASNLIVSDNTFLKILVNDGEWEYSKNRQLHMNRLANKNFSQDFNFQNKDIEIAFNKFIPNAKDTLIASSNGKNYIEIIIAGQGGRVSEFIEEGEMKDINNLLFAFNKEDAPRGSLKIERNANGEFTVVSPFEIGFMKMADKSRGVIDKDTVQEFAMKRLYTLGGLNFVFKGYHESVEMTYTQGNEKDNYADGLVLDVKVDDEEKQVTVLGGKGIVSQSEKFTLNGMNFDLAYGSIYYTAPFYIQLNDFQLERYPGSQSPASFASEVVLIDEKEGINENHRIYMNHVLDYKGYRMFQSSYDKDELGTVLSVNHDAWGTNITYIGYFLMGLGMIISIIMKGSRFSFLRKSIKKVQAKKAALILPLLAVTLYSKATPSDSISLIPIDEQHAEKFAHLLIQDNGGRIKPIHTFSSEVLRKVTRKEKIDGMNASQVILSMMLEPQAWQQKNMIAISHPQLRKEFGVEGNGRYGYAPLLRFFDSKFRYILEKKVEEANQKKPAARSKYDKDIIQVDERVNVCYMVYTYSFLRVFPKPDDKNNKWLAPADVKNNFRGMDSLFVRGIFPMYLEEIMKASKSGDWSQADSTLGYIKKYQTNFGAEVMPSESKVEWEVRYNKQHVFNNLFFYYFTVGFILLTILFIRIFKDNKILKGISMFFIILLVIGFGFHIYGLTLRWYISGHAPWSNAYESMVYIAGATMLAGVVFIRNSQITFAATALLSSLILMVAHLNWLDPEITNLVPVLNSYWLMIHVAIITASYGFLGLGCLLAIINLFLMTVRTKDGDKVTLTLKELSYISEMTLIVGLFMLSIGTFLGGVWANESWGRYWGWDAKETWAFASMMIYTFVLHLRFIPALKNAWTFNFWSMWAFCSIIMTYFGVNYYLSGLHSYAAGDPVPIPTFVYYTVAFFVLLSIASFIRQKMVGKVTLG